MNTHGNDHTTQVIGHRISLSRLAVDAMGRDCKNGAKFISQAEAVRYRFGRPCQVLVDYNVTLTTTFEMCLNQWQTFGCDIWYFTNDENDFSSEREELGTNIHMRGLVFRKREDEEEDHGDTKHRKK
jgi:hypothetical protein